MRTFSVVAVLVCAHLAWLADQETKEKADAKRPLHEHPTLVKMLERNNVLREENGGKPHQMSPELTKLAQQHAWWMARTGNFQHNYNHPYPEIICTGYGSVDEAFQGWMNSGPHRSILLGSGPKAGFGYALSDGGQTYWVGVYGEPKTVETASEKPGLKPGLGQHVQREQDQRHTESQVDEQHRLRSAGR